MTSNILGSTLDSKESVSFYGSLSDSLNNSPQKNPDSIVKRVFSRPDDQRRRPTSSDLHPEDKPISLQFNETFTDLNIKAEDNEQKEAVKPSYPSIEDELKYENEAPNNYSLDLLRYYDNLASKIKPSQSDQHTTLPDASFINVKVLLTCT